MKTILTLAIALSFGVITAQSNVNTSATIFNAGNVGQSSYGASAFYKNPKKIIEGTSYLFENWDNYAVIVTNDKQRFSLKNINLNMDRNVFESRVSADTLFTFNFNNIDKFVVNNRVFKNFYYDDDNRVYEMIYESPEFLVMKGHRVELIESSANPMVNRKNDRYVRRHSYFLKQGDKIRPFKLKKKHVLKLVGGDKERAERIIQYVNNNKLSFKREDDVRKVLEYNAKN